MTDNEMQRMQQEAVRRTQEMQRRAAAYQRSARKETPVSASVVQEPAIPIERHPPEPEPPAVSLPIHEPPDVGREEHRTSGGIFETLFRDKEKTLILGILLLLMDEKTDNSLLMALMYLLI